MLSGRGRDFRRSAGTTSRSWLSNNGTLTPKIAGLPGCCLLGTTFRLVQATSMTSPCPVSAVDPAVIIEETLGEMLGDRPPSPCDRPHSSRPFRLVYAVSFTSSTVDRCDRPVLRAFGIFLDFARMRDCEYLFTTTASCALPSRR